MKRVKSTSNRLAHNALFNEQIEKFGGYLVINSDTNFKNLKENNHAHLQSFRQGDNRLAR